MTFEKFRRSVAAALAVAIALAMFILPQPPARAASDSTYGANVYMAQGGNALQIKAAAGPGILSDNGSVVFNQRFRTSIANVNTGVTLLPAIAGFKYRLIGATMIAVGGAVATCTAVTISGTQSAGAAVLLSVAVAALTQSTPVYPNTANATVLADGASFVQNDTNTAITLGKTGGSCATATNVDVLLTYAIE
jgi:hypothetical protein